VVLVGFALWATISAFDAVRQAHTDLNDAQLRAARVLHDPSMLDSSSGRTAAAADLRQVAQDAQQAATALRNSPGASVLGVVPGLHSQRAGLLQLSDDLQVAATTGRNLLVQANAVGQTSNGLSLSLPALQKLHAGVAAATTRLAGVDRSSSGLWGPIGTARQRFDRDDRELIARLTTADNAVSVVSSLLGTDGPTTYLVVAENNAEMRDQGAVLSYALLHGQNGTLTVSAASSIADLALSEPAPYPIPPGTQAVFGGYEPTLVWQSTNAPADFPWSGGDMAAMYHAATGGTVQGVIALDVPTLQSLLALTGPLSVPGVPGPITSANAASILLNQLYQGTPAGSQELRHDELSLVAQAAVADLSAKKVDPGALARALGEDAAGRHLLLWSAAPQLQRQITLLGASGSVSNVNPSRTFHTAVENATATKLDYFVSVSEHFQIFVSPKGRAIVTTTVTVTNNAPSGQAPSYQLGPDGIVSHTAGQYVAHVYLWGPKGGGVTQVQSTPESGLQVSEQDVSLLPQRDATVQFVTVIPHAVGNGRLSLHLVPQPRLTPTAVTASVDADGWRIQGPAKQSVQLSTSQTLAWTLSPS
jgi:Protein of unknown function (DUF4012)